MKCRLQYRVLVLLISCSWIFSCRLQESMSLVENQNTSENGHFYVSRSSPSKSVDDASVTAVQVWGEQTDLAELLSVSFNQKIRPLSEFKQCQSETLQLVILRPRFAGLSFPDSCDVPVILITDGEWPAEQVANLAWLGVGILDPMAEAERFIAPPDASRLDIQVGAMLVRLRSQFPLLEIQFPQDLNQPPFLSLSGMLPSTDVRDQFYAGGSSDSDVTILRLAAARNGALLISDPDPWVRARSLQHSVSTIVLVNALNDGSSLVRLSAQQRLLTLSRRTPAPEFADAFIQSAGHSDAAIRWKAAHGLQDYPQAVPVLINLLWDPDIDVQREAARSLGGHADPRAIDGLKRVAQSPNGFVRRWATAALGDYKSAELESFLQQQLHDPTRLVALEAHRGLLALGLSPGAMAEYRPPKPPESEEALDKMLKSGDAALRKDAVKFLLTDPDKGDRVVSLLEDPDSDVRKLAVTVLGWSKDSQGHLNDALLDTDPDVVAAALHGLYRQPIADVGRLLTLTNHPDTEIKLRAIEALSVSTDAAAPMWLVKHSTDPDERIRAAVVSRLPGEILPSESSFLVRCAAIASGADIDELGCPNLNDSWGYFGRGLMTDEDRFLHQIFSWNSPEEKPPSHQRIRPPLFRRYGHPDRG